VTKRSPIVRVVDADDLVFRALADPVRRLLLDALFQRDGRSLGELEVAVNQHVEMTRFGVAKHLRLLEQADLVISRKQGRAKLHHLNPVPIQQIHQRWIGKYTERAGVAAFLLDLKHHLETPDALEPPTTTEDDTP
jgi:DNA-binding transcriptional ArsR family regulator